MGAINRPKGQHGETHMELLMNHNDLGSRLWVTAEALRVIGNYHQAELLEEAAEQLEEAIRLIDETDEEAAKAFLKRHTIDIGNEQGQVQLAVRDIAEELIVLSPKGFTTEQVRNELMLKSSHLTTGSSISFHLTALGYRSMLGSLIWPEGPICRFWQKV
jgi:hypothetical protein